MKLGARFGLLSLSLLMACSHAPRAPQDGAKAVLPAPMPTPRLVEKVQIPSRIVGEKPLEGYWIAGQGQGPKPAVVLLHGRGGLYGAGVLPEGAGSEARVWDRVTARHRAWADFWWARGYAVLLVDSFSSRGFPRGFALGSHAQRPATVSEMRVRPRDAWAGFRWLAARSAEVDSRRIALQGWSNGGTAVFYTTSDQGLRQEGAMPDVHSRAVASGRAFRAVIALYPGCPSSLAKAGFRSPVPTLVMIPTNDVEVSSERCLAMVESAHAKGEPVSHRLYVGAEHGFDSPDAETQARPQNETARRLAFESAERFLLRWMN